MGNNFLFHRSKTIQRIRTSNDSDWLKLTALGPFIMKTVTVNSLGQIKGIFTFMKEHDFQFLFSFHLLKRRTGNSF